MEQQKNGGLDRALKLIGWGVSMIVLVIGGVLYLEHRHQTLIEALAEMRADMRHLDTSLTSVRDTNDADHAKIYKALEALNENDQQLVIELTSMGLCCDRPKRGMMKEKPVYVPTASDTHAPAMLPWNIAALDGGLSLKKNLEVK